MPFWNSALVVLFYSVDIIISEMRDANDSLKLTWTVIYHCKRQPYFFIGPLSETGYWLSVFHGCFHLHGFYWAPRTGSEIYKMKTCSCPHRDLKWRPLVYDAIAVTVRPWNLTNYQQVLKLNQVFVLTKFSLCYSYLHHNTWQSSLSCT